MVLAVACAPNSVAVARIGACQHQKMAGPKGSVAVYLLMVSKNQKYVQYAAYDLQDPRVTNNGNQQHGPIAFNGTNIGTQYIPQWCVEHIGSFISQI